MDKQDNRYDVVIEGRTYRVKKPTPLREQHGSCPSWWALQADDEHLCCAICSKPLGLDES